MRLLQFPGVAVAVLAAALVLALTATSGRLFLAAPGDAAVAQELERVGGVPPWPGADRARPAGGDAGRRLGC